jgi:hypothetical protein
MLRDSFIACVTMEVRCLMHSGTCGLGLQFATLAENAELYD